MNAQHYGPVSYHSLGRIFPRSRLRENPLRGHSVFRPLLRPAYLPPPRAIYLVARLNHIELLARVHAPTLLAGENMIDRQPFRIPRGEATTAYYTMKSSVPGGINAYEIHFVMRSLQGDLIVEKSNILGDVVVTGADSFEVRFTSEETQNFDLGFYNYDVFRLNDGVESELVPTSTISVVQSQNFWR